MRLHSALLELEFKAYWFWHYSRIHRSENPLRIANYQQMFRHARIMVNVLDDANATLFTTKLLLALRTVEFVWEVSDDLLIGIEVTSAPGYRWYVDVDNTTIGSTPRDFELNPELHEWINMFVDAMQWSDEASGVQ